MTVVHPGGVRTNIATSARTSGMTKDEMASQAVHWQAFLRLSPKAAAERIARGIEGRDKRVLVGRDAQQIALIQRLLPVGYWGPIKRSLRRQARKATRG